jgi:hypothetical protein
MPIVDFDTECWGDPWFQERTPSGKLLFIYLWTNTHRSVAGFYVITKKTIGDETGLKPHQIETYLEELKPKVRYDPEQSVCWVIKHVRRQFLRSGVISEQVHKGIRKAALKLCYHPFFQEFIDAYPEIFDPEEKETLYRPPIDSLRGSIEGLNDIHHENSSIVLRPSPDSLRQSIDYPGGGGGKGGGGGNDLKESNKEKKEKNKTTPNLCDEEFWKEVRSLYAWLDIDEMVVKMKGYQLTPKGKNWKMTRRSVINWLNKQDKPIEIKEIKPKPDPALIKCKWCGTIHRVKDDHKCP